MPLLPEHFHRIRRMGAVLAAAFLIVAFLPGTAVALPPGVAVTPADANVSADTSVPSSAAQTLTGPTLTENNAGDLGNGSVVLGFSNTSFVFDPSSGALLPPSGCTGRSAAVTSITATTVTADISGSSTAPCTFTFSGLKVRAAVGAMSGPTVANIVATGTAANLPASGYGTLTEVAGAASTVSYATQPAGALLNGSTTVAGGSIWGTQPSITAKDQFNNNATGNVTFAIKVGTGTSGAAMTCSGSGTQGRTFALSGGSATATGCSIDKAGTGYVIQATIPGQTAPVPDSNPFSVVAGAAVGLTFTSFPSNPTTTSLGTIRVALVDAGGNAVVTAPATATTIALTLNTGSLSNCSPAASQVIAASSTTPSATFTGCTTTIGSSRILTATATGGLSATKTTSFDVTSGVASKIAYIVQPAGALSNGSTTVSAGAIWATGQPTVVLQDASGITVTADSSSTITLSITPSTPSSGGPGSVTCTGTGSNPKALVAGQAAFSGCSIGKIGSGYRVRATSSLGFTADSNAFSVVAGAASKLAFMAQPSTGSASQPFPIQPVVAVQDAGGNTVTSGTNSSVTVMLTLAAGAPSGSSLTCTGGVSKAAVAGVATFTGCSINAAGTYTLVATALNPAVGTTLTVGTSSPFAVGALPATITLTNSASVITWGQGVTLNIQFGAGGGNRTFTIERTRDSFTWFTEATLTTNASGFASYVYRPAVNHYFRIRFAGAADLTAGLSNTTRTVVRQIALLRPTNGGVTKSIARNTSITFTTTVRPARPELPKAVVHFVFYRLSGGSWTFVTARDVTIDSLGLASTTFKFTSAGTWYVRSIANPTPSYNANSVWSPIERYNVR